MGRWAGGRPTCCTARPRRSCGPPSARCSRTGATGARCWPGRRPGRPTTPGCGGGAAPVSAVAGRRFPGGGGAEETGRAVAPVPFLGSAVVATAALLAAGDEELLAAVAAGTTAAALGVPFPVPPGASPQPTVRLTPTGGSGYRLTGTVAAVADALPADVLLVPVDGVPYGLYAVAADEAGVSLAPAVSLDMTRQLADLTLTGAPARRIASGDTAGPAGGAGVAAGAAMLAAEQLGLAERCLEMTVAYLKERRQFGRQIGSFQALKHRAADLWVGVAQARAAARYAAACLATADPDTPVAIALAKAACSDIAVRAAQECLQLHGGIGFPWEHPTHLYLKRAKSSSIGFGTADRHRASLAGLVDLPGAGR